MGRPVVHFEVMGRDGKKLQDFYSSLFDWDIQRFDGPMEYGMVDLRDNTHPEAGGIGGGIGGSEDGDDLVTFYVDVPDIEEAFGKAEQLGGKRKLGPDEVPGQNIMIGLFEDPEGHVIGLVAEKK